VPETAKYIDRRSTSWGNINAMFALVGVSKEWEKKARRSNEKENNPF
jgi:hypothetical protein